MLIPQNEDWLTLFSQVKVPVAVAAPIVAVPVFTAASSGARFTGVRENLAYNVTISLTDDKHVDQEGKVYITVFVPGLKQELKLTPEPVHLKAGKNYSYLMNAAYRIERIESIGLEWKKRPGTNIFGSSKIHVNNVLLDPMYITNSTERAAQVKRFCASQVPLELRSEVKTRFSVKCW